MYIRKKSALHSIHLIFIPVQVLLILRSRTQILAPSMANKQLKPIVSLLVFLNFCMYAIVASIGGWAIHIAIDRAFIIGPELGLPAHFTPLFFPIGNAATGFFVIFALIAGVVGAASALPGFNHIRFWNYDSLQPAASSGIIAWALTLIPMGLACKEINLEGRNARLRTMEAFLIILSATQLVYVLVIRGAQQAIPGR